MRKTLTALALASLFLSSSPVASGLPASFQEVRQERAPTRTESELVITFFHPKSPATTLIAAMEQIGRTEVSWDETVRPGTVKQRSRYRFVTVGSSILVQDFAEGNREAMALLKRIDEELSKNVEAIDERLTPMVRETLRLKRLDTMAAVQLIQSSQAGVSVGYTSGVPILTLSGFPDDIAAVKALIEAAERPQPQILMQWSLIEPVKVGDIGDGEVVSEELAAALSPLAPERVFVKSGNFVVRCSADGGAQVGVSSSISSIKGTTPEVPGSIQLQTSISGWEPEARQLNLSDCEVIVSRRNKSGNTSDRLSTDLSIREGETTVIGSLGSEQVFVALTITVVK